MYLFFDTETTGIYNKKRDPDWIGQPRIVQLAAQLCDEHGNAAAVFCLIVKPDTSYIIPAEAAAVHGITTKKAMQDGVPLDFVLGKFDTLCDDAELAVAYNIQFDCDIILSSFKRFMPGVTAKLEKLERHCVMEQCTPICKMPPTHRMLAAGRDGYKPPKLEEAFEYMFSQKMKGAHNAMADVDATKAIFFHLNSQKGAA